MQRRSMFEGNWELKWSAGVGTALVGYMVISCIGGLWEYRSEAGGTWPMIASVLMMMSPMLIGVALNWLGSLRKMRPILLLAGIFYLLNGLFGVVFLLCVATPTILVFRAFYKLGKGQMPRAPRLR